MIGGLADHAAHHALSPNSQEVECRCAFRGIPVAGS